jgi:hypothetical protein
MGGELMLFQCSGRNLGVHGNLRAQRFAGFGEKVLDLGQGGGGNGQKIVQKGGYFGRLGIKRHGVPFGFLQLRDR